MEPDLHDINNVAHALYFGDIHTMLQNYTVLFSGESGEWAHASLSALAINNPPESSKRVTVISQGLQLKKH